MLTSWYPGEAKVVNDSVAIEMSQDIDMTAAYTYQNLNQIELSGKEVEISYGDNSIALCDISNLTSMYLISDIEALTYNNSISRNYIHDPDNLAHVENISTDYQIALYVNPVKSGLLFHELRC